MTSPNLRADVYDPKTLAAMDQGQHLRRRCRLLGFIQSDGMITQVRQNCGAGMRWNEALGRCATTSARRNVRRGVVTGN